LSTTSRPTSSSRLPSRHTFSWLLLIGANVLWATSYVTGKFALDGVSLTMMLAMRMLLSALIIFPLLFIRRRDFHITWKDLPQLALLSFIGFVVNKLLEFGGLNLATALDVALLITSESLFTALLSWILLREPFRKQSLLALVLGMFGVYLVVEQGLLPNLPAGGGIWRIIGDLLVILALLMEAFYSVRGKTLLVKHSPLLITAASIVGSMLFWLPVAGGELLFAGGHLPGPGAWLAIAWLALFCTVLPYLAWFQGLAKVNGSLASATLFIQPLLGTLLAVIFQHDSLTPATIIGGLLIIVSVYLISR
jgi:drug/metabolite transporter (DMT)-like permease